MKVLLLDSGWQPVTIISWEKAIRLVFLEKAEIIKEYKNEKIRTVSKEFSAPAIVKVNYSNRGEKNKISCSSSNIFYRDKYTCAYCGKKTQKNELTLDHIYPVSQGGKRSWKNLITACRKCNQKKGSRTPKEAGMPLLWKPKEPKWSFAFALKLSQNDPIGYWSEYIYGLDDISG